jgi:hypothetical protein
MCKEAFRELASDFSSEIIWEARQKGYTAQMLSLKIGKEPKTLYNISSDPSKYLSLPAFLGILVTAQAKETVKKLAELVGLRAVEVSRHSLPTSIGRVMKETGEAIAEVTKALEDGEITEEERKACLKEINEAIDELLKLKNQLEERF